ncbi:glycoside hydrolase family 16 protein [Neolewinella persica]|uniref:glycoside hydrolase family 16 protein n=1 Tax=Neolewinella persica TaxID=70998 RepID=UPI00037909BC|nr:glycoside hydrolase family 16 protein [Neolewinella persica]
MRILICLLLFSLVTSLTSCNRKIKGKDTDLIWADEFNGHEPPNSAKWGFDIGTGDWGWGNNELQYYTNRPENVRLLNGKLVIEAHKEDYEGSKYTSGRVVTRNKASWVHKRIAIRAKLASGRGTWSAIWMLGDKVEEVGWPLGGEIDIMEHVGHAPDTLFGTVHTKAFNHMLGTEDGGNTTAKDLETNFHIYSIDWHEDRIEFKLDGNTYHTFHKRDNATDEEWPFDEPHYLLMNLAVGGMWGSVKGVDEDIWPRRMEIDWVRVYKL